MPVAIRLADVSDLDALVAIETGAFSGDRISRRSFRKFLDRQTAETLLAHEEGRAVGYALVLFRAGSASARLYSIAAAGGGAGVGRALLAAAEALAAGRGCRAMRLEVRDDNPRAIRLYERAGYVLTGMREGYYEDGAPARLYRKQLVAPGGVSGSGNGGAAGDEDISVRPFRPTPRASRKLLTIPTGSARDRAAGARERQPK